MADLLLVNSLADSSLGNWNRTGVMFVEAQNTDTCGELYCKR